MNCKHKGKVICVKCGYNVARLTQKEIKELREYFYKDTADLCEVAHTITSEICEANGIPVNCKSARSCGDKNNEHGKNTDMTHYSGKAQDIFNRYFDLLDNTSRN